MQVTGDSVAVSALQAEAMRYLKQTIVDKQGAITALEHKMAAAVRVSAATVHTYTETATG